MKDTITMWDVCEVKLILFQSHVSLCNIHILFIFDERSACFGLWCLHPSSKCKVRAGLKPNQENFADTLYCQLCQF